MVLIEPCPNREGLVAAIGEAGRRLSDTDASEGATGSNSVCIGWPIEVHRGLTAIEELTLPNSSPALAGKPPG